MGEQDKKRAQTEQVSVEVVNNLLEENLTDKQKERCADISGMTIVVEPSERANAIPKGKSPISAIAAGSVGRNPEVIDVHGSQRVEETETTEELNRKEAEEKRRIAEMPSPKDDENNR